VERLGAKASAGFLFLGVLAMLAGWFDVANDPLSYIFAALLGMPWMALLDSQVSDSLAWNSFLAIAAICLNAVIIYFVFSWIGRRISRRQH
jgi:hypothetical protein